MVHQEQTAGRPASAARVTRILAPTDFAMGAEPALRWAATFGEAFDAEVILLHVLDLRLGALAGLPPESAAMPAVDELARIARAEAAQQMSQLAKRYPQARTLIREGSPRALILDVAASEGTDLIVMGTHGRTGLAHVFFGSVAEHVVRQSRIPVLTVRQETQS